jgi:NAD+ synthase
MELNPVLREHTAEIIESFIRSKVEECGASGVVLGLSGGIDSAVVAKLCAQALGRKKVLALVMPAGPFDKAAVADAVYFAKKLGIVYRVIDVAPIVGSFRAAVKGRGSRTSTGNMVSRARMVVIYYHANSMGLLVMGTGNKSELLMGYFTKFGDGGADYLPLGDLYKTQVRELAKELRIPGKIIRKMPTAGLWEGQTDEGEMGIKYGTLDKILYGLELGLDEAEIHERTGIPRREVERLHERVRRAAHKRKMPLIPKLGVRTLGADWRE